MNGCAVKVFVEDPHIKVTPGSSARATAEVSVRGRGARVRMSFSGLPTGVSARIDPSELDASGRATFTLTASPHTRIGTYSVALKAACGNRSDAALIRLVVVPERQGQQFPLDPASAEVKTGGSTRFCLRLPSQRGLPSTPSLKVEGLPEGVTTSLARRQARNGCWYLTVRVGDEVDGGDYPFLVTVRRPRKPALTAAAILRVTGERGQPFTISGDLKGELVPGIDIPLDLTFTNPNSVPIRLTSLIVRIDSVDDAHAAACPVEANYKVTQFAGDLRAIRIPARSAASLSSLALPQAVWPRIGMLDTDDFQDGCRGARLKLEYVGKAVEP